MAVRRMKISTNVCQRFIASIPGPGVGVDEDGFEHLDVPPEWTQRRLARIPGDGVEVLGPKRPRIPGAVDVGEQGHQSRRVVPLVFLASLGHGQQFP